MTVQCESNNVSSVLHHALYKVVTYRALLSALFDFNITVVFDNYIEIIT